MKILSIHHCCPVAAALLLTACGDAETSGNLASANISADIGRAAEAAQGDIDTYAANQLEHAAPQALAAQPRLTAAPRVSAGAGPEPAHRTDERSGEPELAVRPADTAEPAATYRCSGETRVSVRVEPAQDGARDADKSAPQDAGQTAGGAGIWSRGVAGQLAGSTAAGAPDRPAQPCAAP